MFAADRLTTHDARDEPTGLRRLRRHESRCYLAVGSGETPVIEDCRGLDAPTERRARTQAVRKKNLRIRTQVPIRRSATANKVAEIRWRLPAERASAETPEPRTAKVAEVAAAVNARSEITWQYLNLCNSCIYNRLRTSVGRRSQVTAGQAHGAESVENPRIVEKLRKISHLWPSVEIPFLVLVAQRVTAIRVGEPGSTIPCRDSAQAGAWRVGAWRAQRKNAKTASGENGVTPDAAAMPTPGAHGANADRRSPLRRSIRDRVAACMIRCGQLSSTCAARERFHE